MRQVGPCVSQEFRYLDLTFCRRKYLNTSNNCAKFKPNPWFEHYHTLPDSLMDTLLSYLYRLITGIGENLSREIV